ncbi:MAG: ADP-ribosylglycohydrolase family protein [Candidatus Hinthialibacter antarcticus]|nr:ADP-ribosylglycohydrolase family protein [Candidatus Hinthialibacter antarcticus]
MMMMSRWIYATVCVVVFSLSVPAETVKISEDELLNKIKGGWLGQIIGVVVGGPTEFRAQAKLYEQPLNWDAKEVKDAINQDDLYVEMTFARVMDELGLDAPMSAYGEAFADSEYWLWHANFMGRHNLRNGITPPDSGHPKYNSHADDIDFQIEADFIGLMCPGLIATSNRFCDTVGHVMNYGDGVYGGMFVCAMYAEAYYESDPRKLVEAGVAALPPQSEYAQAIRDVLSWSMKTRDWKQVWQLFEDKWANTDICSEGTFRDFDIDAKTNGAYIAIGMLYGGGDFKKTIEISTRCGQDSDCNPSSAAGVLGVVFGYEKLPQDWKDELQGIIDQKFAYTDYSFNEIAQSTLKRAKQLILKSGGKQNGGVFSYEREAPVAAKLEQWKQERPTKIVEVNSTDFVWSGEWNSEDNSKWSAEKGARATLTFEGTGVMVRGRIRKDGCILNAYIDGKKQRTFNLFNATDERGGESIFHVFGLPKGKHTVAIEHTGTSDPQSEGAVLQIQNAFLFDGPEQPRAVKQQDN